MKLRDSHSDASYRTAMGQLLVLYTQVDRLIMEACAERIATAPDESAKLALAKQVGDESRHVAIQNEWMQSFATDRTPVISAAQEAAILAHFRQLDWMDFLTDMYLCVEALGSDAVEKVVPLADLGNRTLPDSQLAARVERYASKPLSESFGIDDRGNLYVTDIERIEVLPGPQGTLFGASSMAGTVRLQILPSFAISSYSR